MLEFFNRIPAIVRLPKFYGFIGGILGFVLLLILYYINQHPFLIPPYFDFRVLFFGIFIYFILKELRDYHFGGLLFFWQGLIASGLFVLTYSLVSSLLIWVFAINVPEFVIKYGELMTNRLNAYPKESIEQIGQDTFNRTIAQLKTTTAGDLAKLYFRQALMIGLFVSIILSVILRRQPKI